METGDNTDDTPSKLATFEATSRRRFRREFWIWVLSACLTAPVALLYLSHYVNAVRQGMHPTGFIQIDMPFYMAHAREHFDGGQFALMYTNSSNPYLDSPRIYFQPITLLHGLILYFFQPDPGTLSVVTVAIFSIVAVRIAIALFQDLYGIDTRAKRLTLVCFIWSGGLLAAAGAIRAAITGEWTFTTLFHFDPFRGMWFLNLGRNLIFPTEAMYHALSLGCILLLCRKRFAAGVACLALLSISHPFTGTQFVLIVGAWLTLEKFFVRSRDVPSWALASTLAIAVVHFWYYLGFLPSYDEHTAVVSAFAVDWSMKAQNMVPAYALVALLACWRMRNPRLAMQTLGGASNRLLIVWFFVSFLLANHEFAFTPHQPLHFTRGYVWTPLFLLGAPTLISVLDRVMSVRHVGGLLTCLLLALLLADNVVWFTGRCILKTGVRVTPDDESLIQYLASVSDPLLVVCESDRVGYLTTVYTKHRAWHSHPHNTPNSEVRKQQIEDYLTNNAIPEEWRNRNVVVIVLKKDSRFPNSQQLQRTASWPPPIYENSSFKLVKPQFSSHL